MSEATAAKRQGTGKWFSLLAKIVFVLTVILCVLLAVLSSLGGDSKPLKEAAEQFIGARVGARTVIEKLSQMTFYPYMGVDFEGMNAYRGDDSSNSLVTAERVSIAMGFWDVTFGTGKLKTLNVVNLKAVPGTLLRKGLSVDYLSLIDEGDEAFIRSEGKIGAAPYRFSAPIEKFGSGKGRKYAFADIRPFQATVGDIHLNARLETLDSDIMKMGGIELGRGDAGAHTLRGDLTLYYGGAGRMTLKGDLHYGAATLIRPDLLLDMDAKPPKISGQLVFEKLGYEDALAYQDLVDLVRDLKQTLFDAPDAPEKAGYDWSHLDIDAQVIVKEFVHNDVPFASFDAPLTLKGGVLRFGPFGKGAAADAKAESGKTAVLKDGIVFDTTKKPAELSVGLRVKDFDYTALHRAFSGAQDVKGRAGIVVDLATAGDDKAALKQNLRGHLSVIAGEGQYPVQGLNVWGEGLVNAMLPGLDAATQTNMNCAVADFEFKNGQAEANALFLDTDAVTVSGKGGYDYPADALDLTLQPQAKQIEILDFRAVPVVMSGSLADPQIAPSALGIVKKLGGLSLGLVNPAFLAYSLTDLGLSESHPCRPYIGNGQTE